MTIEVDYSKCTKPESCRACLSVCQPAVFVITFTDRDYHNPKRWRVEPTFTQLCTNCRLCSMKCPKKAIRLSAH